MTEQEFTDLCPTCEACGHKITDEYFIRIGKWCFHEDCTELVATDSYVVARGEENDYCGELEEC